ncbi:MAG TPA: trypsin-like serine protease [Pilimelia sp.]|nr:trypsin-like serine protease [Pilimelia sp.]
MRLPSAPRPRTAPRAHAARRVGAVAVAVLALVLGAAGPAAAVANGEPVPSGQYRFSVKLTMTGIPRVDGTTYNSACSGALVAPGWVITAGHCFHRFRVRVSGPVPYPTTATVGVANLADPGARVANVVEVFQAAPDSDVALARLDRAVRGVRPIRVRAAAPEEGEILRLTGWGATGPDTTHSSQLHTGQVEVTSVAATTVGVQGYAPAPDTSACPWDSGAPYFVERRRAAPLLVSLESTGPDCPHAEEETTARLDVLAGWIKATIG